MLSLGVSQNLLGGSQIKNVVASDKDLAKVTSELAVKELLCIRKLQYGLTRRKSNSQTEERKESDCPQGIHDNRANITY